MSDVKAQVAALFKLPKAERLERLVAMSAECVKRQEDAAPLLSLIQLELDTPDDNRPASSVAPSSSRPASIASTAAGGAAAAPAAPAAAPCKSVRRQLKEKRDELRAMLARVDNALGSSSSGGPSSQRTSKPDSVAFAHMSRGAKLQLARQAGFRPASSGAAASASQGISNAPPPPRVEVPEHIRQRFKEEYDADPEGFRKTWSEQTDEFRRLCSEQPSKPPTPMVSKPPTPMEAEPRRGNNIFGPGGSRGGAGTTGLDDAQIEALLRKANVGGKAQVSGARAAGSSFSF